ncbi:MAG: hypothetical protein ACOYMS_05875, partial [Terrimicrobiaceae bacterium]
MSVQSDWEIKSRAHCCARTGLEFAEGDFFYTLLFRDGEGFRREDLCEEAWAERNDNIAPFSFWRSKYEAPPPPLPEALPKDDAEGLLRRLIADQHPATANARYILALMLERKRVLRPVESQDDDMLVYEHLASGETIVIPNPRLSFVQIPEVQREVSELLAGSI